MNNNQPHHHNHQNNNNKKKKKNITPEVEFRLNLDHCSKTKDLSTAIILFDSATAATTDNIRLNHQHFNSLLYICSNAVSEPPSPSSKQSAIEFGFKVFDYMLSSNIMPNEATATAVARLAAARDDGEKAFELAKGVGKAGRLRTYGPALFCFCRNKLADKAFEVEAHMNSLGLQLEEPEFAALLKVSMEMGMQEKVYEYLHKLRGVTRGVNESTADIIESWFGGEKASVVGSENWDVGQLKEAILRNGGGWHGLGWLGKGKWVVQRSNIAPDGRCIGCGEQLVCVDTDRMETEKFAQSVASLAMEREVDVNFKEFQEWLEKHSEYEAVVDGANIGFYQQNFAEGGFSVTQLDAVVKELYNRNKKWPLVVLHTKRVRALYENAANRELLDKWINEEALFSTPYGSNDDWYWLYAAVKLKCLLVTNDEMRDHIFELLGSNFFGTWKERHQVKYTFCKGNPKLLTPPLYSFVIQESEKGSWHVPFTGETNDESSRTWICVTRPGSREAHNKYSESVEAVEVGQKTCNNLFLTISKTEEASRGNGLNGSDTPQILGSELPPITGKRKERSPPHSGSDP